MKPGRIRWGLCCLFVDAPIKFRRATHRYVSSLPRKARRPYLSAIARDNALALQSAIKECHRLGIGAFRINSQILPLATHPSSGYALEDLDDAGTIIENFRAAGSLARQLDIRLSFHPDQFVVLNSVRDDVVQSSLRELDSQAVVAELVRADTITLHAGSLAEGVQVASDRLMRGIDQVSDRVRRRLALENDDRLYTVTDLLPVAEAADLPIVFDVHHHRCHPDSLSIEEASERAAATWGTREPYFHISSPRDGHDAANPRPHADYVSLRDVPKLWRRSAITVDVEAKAKERAVLRIKKACGQ